MTGALVGMIALAMTAFAGLAGFFDADPVHMYGMERAVSARVAVVFFSSDMGLRVGMGSYVAPALAAHGIPVFAISSPAMFGVHRSQADVNALVTASIRGGLARSGARKVILIGGSFGSDILIAGLGALPPDLRSKVAAVVLVVPGQAAYFGADPTGLRYLGGPDADTAPALRQIRWVPLICIYGQRETASLCPSLLGTSARVIELPGGHFLNRDHDTLVATILNAIRPILQQNED